MSVFKLHCVLEPSIHHELLVLFDLQEEVSDPFEVGQVAPFVAGQVAPSEVAQVVPFVAWQVAPFVVAQVAPSEVAQVVWVEQVVSSEVDPSGVEQAASFVVDPPEVVPFEAGLN